MGVAWRSLGVTWESLLVWQAAFSLFHLIFNVFWSFLASADIAKRRPFEHKIPFLVSSGLAECAEQFNEVGYRTHPFFMVPRCLGGNREAK